VIGGADSNVVISPSQALKLLAIGNLIRDGDMEIRGDDETDVALAKEAIIDVAQEIALQVHR
jgi:hypothetical protein